MRVIFLGYLFVPKFGSYVLWKRFMVITFMREKNVCVFHIVSAMVTIVTLVLYCECHGNHSNTGVL